MLCKIFQRPKVQQLCPFQLVMATRLQFDSSCDIGVYSKLTNAYCLVGIVGSQKFDSTFEDELAHIPGFQVIQTSINGSWKQKRASLPYTTTPQGTDMNWAYYDRIRAIEENNFIYGWFALGNIAVHEPVQQFWNWKKVSSSVMLPELQHLRNSLPDSFEVKCVDEAHSALGNCIACNDDFALIHPDLDKILNLRRVTQRVLGSLELVDCFECVFCVFLVNPVSFGTMAATNPDATFDCITDYIEEMKWHVERLRQLLPKLIPQNSTFLVQTHCEESFPKEKVGCPDPHQGKEEIGTSLVRDSELIESEALASSKYVREIDHALFTFNVLFEDDINTPNEPSGENDGIACLESYPTMV
ncbi:hypothetical protein FXO37_06663 [Capsicum annuum]|nr:hypothetical protein FXO37_06663 [Capsicum annuum]